MKFFVKKMSKGEGEMSPSITPAEQEQQPDMAPTENNGSPASSAALIHDDGDGDDEREDEDDEAAASNDGDEDGEETESVGEEPRLKYQRMGGSVPSLLSGDAACCITVAERIIALGTHDGTVHLLDYQGNQVKEFAAHTATVNELSFDAAGEYIGSCSDDGSVVINSLYTDEKEKFEYHRPMKAVALDPEYASKSGRQFAAGGLAGNLIFSTKGWLGVRNQILHSGEGPIHAVKWRTTLIAWANDVGVKVFDTGTHRRITFIERPKGSPRAELLRPHLVWQDDTLLLIGWANCIKIAAVRTRSLDNTLNKGKPGGVAMPLNSEFLGSGRNASLLPGTKYVEIVAVLQLDHYICGVAPYGDALVVLTYIPEKEAEVAEPSIQRQSKTCKRVFQEQGHSQRPEVCILTWQNEELATDALSIHGYEHYKAKDYFLTHAPFSGSSSAGGQWAAGDEPLYYIVSPKDVVIARPRDADDHVNWLLQHGWHERALAAVEAGKARTELLDEVGSRYLDHLLLERQYAQAAALCPKLLRGSASAWEQWVFHFAHLRQLPSLAPYIPTSNPMLRDTVYEVVLNALLTNPAHHEQLQETIRSWPPNIYSVPTIISAIELQLTSGSKSSILKEVLAELLIIEQRYDNALGLYVELGKANVFEFIEEHGLYDYVHDKVVSLLKIDEKKAVSLLVQHRGNISVAEVVAQLQKAAQDNPHKRFLHSYLHALFEKDPNAGEEFQGLQVELYAEYEPRLLLPFLRSSHHYSLDKAYEICSRRGLTRERVFILGRMGNTREALALIINKLKDMQEAIEFVVSQHDEDLWEELINQSSHNPEMVGALLEHTVGNIDPLHLVNQVPSGMKIPRLRDRLVKIITDYRTETSLRHGCNSILKTDCVDLLVRYYAEARHAIHVGGKDDMTEGPYNNWSGADQDSSLVESKTDLKGGSKSGRILSKMGGSGRCCICLDSVALQNVAVIAFFCTHAYHITCLNNTFGQQGSLPPAKQHKNLYASKSELSGKENSGKLYDRSFFEDSKDEGEDFEAKTSTVSCILCTAAAAASRKKNENKSNQTRTPRSETTTGAYGWGAGRDGG
ncbi:hypothetical protein O6H91_23G012400 [Diphasiastrum complanatum]|uniref:Uncharacterized protein n=1 Tax=Diphasiastrum complanatum TaxID=34168 RepID=A0ACC2A876_DIPCM|nr:hypothetical protein O6H91_23G012400 [Diphasiastrum complanatum]